MRVVAGSVLLAGVALPQARPGGGPGSGPGYHGTMASPEGRAAVVELQGRESAAAERMFGPGPWRVGKLRNPTIYLPGPGEKDVLRIGALVVKGPYLELESPFCLWCLPIETDGDVAFVHELFTGEAHPTLAGDRSERLAAALRFFRHYGTIVRGLRTALVSDTERVTRGKPVTTSLVVYNASGQPVDVIATTTVHVGDAKVAVEVGNRYGEPTRIVLEPGQRIERSIDLAALRFSAAEAEPRGFFDAVEDGKTELHVELALAPDARGNRGVVSSVPTPLEIVPAERGDGSDRR